MTPAATRGPYAKSAQVKQRILEACIDTFGETGFYGATMKDIAQRAGISHTGLLHHFPRKEDVLAAVLELRDERGLRYLESVSALAPEEDPLKALRGMLAIVVDNELRPGLMELHCVMSGEATSARHPAHAYYTERYRMLREFYANIFTALAEGGELHTDIEPEALATMTISLLNGLQAQWLYDRETVRIEASLRAFLTSYIPGLAR
ncbi:TetR/AcrR family transcriptional regulator [Actinomadura sp. WMMB 499]|uniref:TetR/AcrR family transcriptional regulator n=1 Tax=Actinomadura sp. WMMB 499 TaxID=1219491 RepID=UPI0012479C1F|nr:TetR/AcrR family transcriptional regulator [Actinomadura sp. WMMB 499]QFG21304.1 TetR/AcrR family transcriptional regulator [Actinomadura sp. WMMB 499]